MIDVNTEFRRTLYGVVLITACAAMLVGCDGGARWATPRDVQQAEKACEPHGGLRAFQTARIYTTPTELARPQWTGVICDNGFRISGTQQ